MKLQLPKGTRDFPPEEKLLRDEVVGTLKNIFERYGFSPLETPMFERFDVLSQKYAGGAEILKETFKFQDQGKRELALRYDLTVPFARFVGMNPQLKMPFKRYAIGRSFRDGPIKLGRYREFYQCDVDIVGSTSMLADAECIKVAAAVFAALNIPVTIAVNNRKILEALLEKSGVKKEKMVDAMLTLDKLKKIPMKDIKKELKEKKIPEQSVDPIINLNSEKSTEKKLAEIKKILGENGGVEEFEALLTGVGDITIEFDISLTRGLAYYTSTVFEIFAKESAISSSLGGGGRYDRMIGELVGKGEIPAVGISFGVEPILDVLAEQGREKRKSATRLYVAPIKAVVESLPIVEQFRAAGVNTDVDLKGKAISKNLDYANSYGIPFVLIVGKQELEQGKVKLRDMSSGKEELLTVAAAIKQLQKRAS